MGKQANETPSRRAFFSQTARVAAGTGLMLSAARWNTVLGANDRLRLGVIGTGNRGGDVMAKFMQTPNVEVAALCDVYDKHLNNALAATGGKAKTYADYQALLDSKDVDAVLIATPDPWHAQMCLDSLHAGKDVYCEKPLTFSIEEGYKIMKAVRDTKRVFATGLQQRSGEHYAEAKKEFFDTERIGKVTLVRTWWHGNSYHLRKPNFKDKPAGLDWKKFLGPVKYRDFDAQQFYNWRAYLDFGGGQITDLFTHWIDVVHWFMGEDVPVAASAAGGVFHYKDGRTAPDTIAIQLEYPSNWVATFEATLVPGARGAAIEFMGTGGRLTIDRGGYQFQEMTPRKATASEPITRQMKHDITIDHTRNFAECVRSRKTPNSDVVGGHRSALASHLGKMAYLKKHRVTFDAAKEKTVA
jgi:predicted dehydrogenase